MLGGERSRGSRTADQRTSTLGSAARSFPGAADAQGRSRQGQEAMRPVAVDRTMGELRAVRAAVEGANRSSAFLAAVVRRRFALRPGAAEAASRAGDRRRKADGKREQRCQAPHEPTCNRASAACQLRSSTRCWSKRSRSAGRLTPDGTRKRERVSTINPAVERGEKISPSG